MTFPTHTGDRLGSDNFSLGPAAVVFVLKAPFTYGALTFSQWSVIGPDDEPSTNQTTLQPFLNYNLSDGWSLGSAPIVTFDWAADDGMVTLPVGGGVSKLFSIGQQPMKFAVNTYYNALRPDSGPRWQVQAQLTLFFPQ